MLEDILYIDCDMNLAYSNAELELDGTDLDSGTCTAELFSPENVSISGPISLTRTGNSYKGILESMVTSDLTVDTIYYLTYTFDQSNVHDFRKLEYRAKYRGKS